MLPAKSDRLISVASTSTSPVGILVSARSPSSVKPPLTEMAPASVPLVAKDFVPAAAAMATPPTLVLIAPEVVLAETSKLAVRLSP